MAAYSPGSEGHNATHGIQRLARSRAARPAVSKAVDLDSLHRATPLMAGNQLDVKPYCSRALVCRYGFSRHCRSVIVVNSFRVLLRVACVNVTLKKRKKASQGTARQGNEGDGAILAKEEGRNEGSFELHILWNCASGIMVLQFMKCVKTC